MRQKSIITDNFYIQLITTLQCNCGKSNFYFQKLIDIPLLIPLNKTKVTLIELLNNCFNIEKVEVTYSCDSCKSKQNFSKSLKIAIPPNILIISLQRFDYINNIKNECIIDIDETLILDDYIDNECYNKKENKYYLYGIINHIGSFNFGHYYSLIKIEKRKNWTLFDDNLVKPLDNEINLFKNSYILFYLNDKYQ